MVIRKAALSASRFMQYMDASRTLGVSHWTLYYNWRDRDRLGTALLYRKPRPNTSPVLVDVEAWRVYLESGRNLEAVRAWFYGQTPASRAAEAAEQSAGVRHG